MITKIININVYKYFLFVVVSLFSGTEIFQTIELLENLCWWEGIKGKSQIESLIIDRCAMMCKLLCIHNPFIVRDAILSSVLYNSAQLYFFFPLNFYTVNSVSGVVSQNLNVKNSYTHKKPSCKVLGQKVNHYYCCKT